MFQSLTKLKVKKLLSKNDWYKKSFLIYITEGHGYGCTFSFLSKGIILLIELTWPENPANTCDRHTEPLDNCSVCCAQVFAGFSGRGNSTYNIIPLIKKENVHLRIICLHAKCKLFVLVITQKCWEQYWTSPGGNIPQDTNYTATCLSSRKLYKLDEPETQDTAGEARTNSSMMYSYGSPHMAKQKQDDQLEHTYIQQLCEDTGCRPEDLPKAMNDREKWRERVRDIRASGTTWW